MIIDRVTTERLDEVADTLLRFAGNLRIVALFGEMGAGKTTFIRSFCARLGVEGPVTSPTFSIVNEYQTSEGERVFHFDFYRLKNEREALDIGLDEYLDSGSWCLLEWPEKVLDLLPKPRVDVRLTVVDGLRRFEFSYV